MMHLLHLLKALFYTFLIVGIPTLVITGGRFPPEVIQHPAYQFFALLVFAYTAAPVISDFAGNHVGKSLFFPDRANLDHPTMSHIITLRNKRLYKEALEELRMLTDLHPDELEPYKMLLHLTAHELPDRRLFDMFFRKGMFNLVNENEKVMLKRYRDEHVQHKENEEEEWRECSHAETAEEHHERHFFVNREHHRKRSKILVDSHSGTLPRKVAEIRKTQKAYLPSHITGDTQSLPKVLSVPPVEEKKEVPLEKKTDDLNIVFSTPGDEIEPEPTGPKVTTSYVFRRKQRKKKRL